MAKKKHEEHEEHVNHERWMVSYADMLTLLLALFIVMFAISKVDAQKFTVFAAGASEAFGSGSLAVQGKSGNLDGGAGILDGQGKTTDTTITKDSDATSAAAKAALNRQIAAKAAANAEHEEMAKVRDQITKQLAAKGLKNSVQFTLDERGLVVNIVTDKVLFDTGEATLRAGGVKVLALIAPSLKSLSNKITVEGHTDNVPMSGTFTSNWELSTSRATTVVRALLASGLPAKRVSAAGYADQRPLVSNGTASGRARNRRVAIVVLPNVTLDSDTTTDTTSTTGTSTTTTSTATTATSESTATSGSEESSGTTEHAATESEH